MPSVSMLQFQLLHRTGNRTCNLHRHVTEISVLKNKVSFVMDWSDVVGSQCRVLHCGVHMWIENLVESARCHCSLRLYGVLAVGNIYTSSVAKEGNKHCICILLYFAILTRRCTAPMYDKICGHPYNFKIAFIRWDLLTLTFDISTSKLIIIT